MTTKTPFHLLILPALLLAFLACEKKDTAAKDPKVALQDRGRIVYQTNCIACHNSNPRQPGSIGPELFGSSQELIEARVMRAEYPAGYTPKRPTHGMTALPHLKDEIEAIHAYLNAQ